MNLKLIASSVLFFVVAGLLEIGGGYLVWQWLREGRGWWIGLIGGLLLMLYGIVPTFQPANFGRVYAAYGGVFVVGSLAWGWAVDDTPPDGADAVGALLCVIGVLVMMYWPRP